MQETPTLEPAKPNEDVWITSTTELVERPSTTWLGCALMLAIASSGIVVGMALAILLFHI
jgi:hypothetical protein